MHLQLSVVQLITICAIANGFVFGFLVLRKKENRFANRFLALTIICMCLTFTPYMLDPPIWQEERWLAWLPFSLSYWIGPAFYFYVKSLTQPDWRFTKRQLWHFAPILLNYIHSIYHGIFSGNHHPYYWFHTTAELFQSAAIISVLIYMLITLRMINRYQHVLLDNVSNTAKIDLQWVKQIIRVIIISFAFILVFLIISTGLSGMVFFEQWDQYRTILLMLYACVLYWLSIHGFLQAQTLQLLRPEKENHNLPVKEFEVVIEKLHRTMQTQRVFKNPDLSLSDLSREVGISERAISEAINRGLGKNFFQFINEYRVKEVQEILIDPACSHLKIISLAFDSGFNSKATFNRIFKSYTGLTPKEYKSKNMP
ncbi:helix-turn-helix domain-containing protein [Flagellimonas flava]|uniref:Transcriptional regulator, AraC family n=1 Tax=Flagellimonas flava TaxID=570519 RepID=A0A1M5ME24_9FLAO|nr:helix-turn-helix domain-containing protein [Allomuricauda flava]SHG75588.1 transcriptional regulator, AraC family [Allomuricauda flava]